MEQTAPSSQDASSRQTSQEIAVACKKVYTDMKGLILKVLIYIYIIYIYIYIFIYLKPA